MTGYVDKGRREGDIESRIVKAGKLRGWRQRKMQFVGRSGCPDRWFQRDHGQLVILEIKDPDGVRSYAQKKEIKWLNANGFHAHFVDSVQQAIEIFDAWDNELLG